MTTATRFPASIAASINEDAIERVASFFSATLTDILNELLQNARRSGATLVNIDHEPESGRISVTDNGHGIADPSALLSFGGSQWKSGHARREHPAGMGLYALARNDHVSVTTRLPDGTGWTIQLTPDHFTGKASAPVEPLASANVPQATTVSFSHPAPDIRTLEQVTQYFPLPVYHNGERLPHHDFLQSAVHSEVWQGVRIGVYPRRTNGKLNFHGIVIDHPKLPEVGTIEETWSARADVIDAPGLELTLPARKEIVETEFAGNLRTACRKAIYNAIAVHPEPIDVPKAVRDAAAAMGVDIQDARALLRPWVAETAHWYQSPDTPPRSDVPQDSLVIDFEALPADQQVLARAAERHKVTDSLFSADDRLAGYKWYDRLTKAHALSITITSNGQDADLARCRASDQSPYDQRPEAITLTLGTTDAAGTEGQYQLAADVALPGGEDAYLDDQEALATPDSDIQVHELVDLMMGGYFSPGDAAEDDSWDTQEEQLRRTFSTKAMRMLTSAQEADRRTIETYAHEYVSYHVPAGQMATVTMSRGKVLEVSLSAPETPDN